jgi:predicted nucleotidyltransferase
MALLGEILSSKVREQIFLLLFDGSQKEVHMRELERRSGCAIGTIQTELKKLARLDLVVSRRDGNRLYYRANREHPVYVDLCGLVAKTSGVVGQLKEALSGLPQVECAFLFGSVAVGTEGAQSDIDLMVVGTVGLRALSGVLKDISSAAQREINPHVITGDELRLRINKDDHFISHVMKSKKLFVKGGENDLTELAG